MTKAPVERVVLQARHLPCCRCFVRLQLLDIRQDCSLVAPRRAAIEAKSSPPLKTSSFAVICLGVLAMPIFPDGGCLSQEKTPARLGT